MDVQETKQQKRIVELLAGGSDIGRKRIGMWMAVFLGMLFFFGMRYPITANAAETLTLSGDASYTGAQLSGYDTIRINGYSLTVTGDFTTSIIQFN